MYNFKRVIFNNHGVRTYQNKEDNRIFISVADMIDVCQCTSFRKYAIKDKDCILISKSEANGQGFYMNRGAQTMSCIPINGIQRIAKSYNMRATSKDAMLACTEACADSWLNPDDVTEKTEVESSADEVAVSTNAKYVASNEKLMLNKLNCTIEAQKKRMLEMEEEFNLLREENAELARRFNAASEENEELTRRLNNCNGGVCESTDLNSIISVLENKLNEAKVAAKKYEEIISIIKGMV